MWVKGTGHLGVGFTITGIHAVKNYKIDTSNGVHIYALSRRSQAVVTPAKYENDTQSKTSIW